MFQIQEDAYFRTDLKQLAHRILMLKSNFKLVGRKFVRCFYCASKFQDIWSSLSPSKRLAFFQIRINFPKKSSNFNEMSLGSNMQIKYTDKLSMHKAGFS